MKLDTDKTAMSTTQETLKQEITVCKDADMNNLVYQVTQGFSRTYLLPLLTKQTLRILRNKKIAGFMYLNPKYH